MKKKQVWGSHLKSSPNEANIRFCAGRDVTSIGMADEKLLSYDVWTNLAHSTMLKEAGVMKEGEFREIKAALLDLLAELEEEKFQLDPSKEDVHINIEHYVTHTKGIEAGKKMHTGRSRNDQVATDIRLYLRDELLEFAANLGCLIESILKKAEDEKETYMPGFTHYQPGMPTTFAHWLTSWSQALLRDLKRLLNDIKLINKSPLGAAASFGTSWPINRELSADLLGFDAVEENSLDCISSRGEQEAQAASTVSFCMTHLSTVSQDMILLTTPYYNMLSIDDAYVTGSSIMPQKRNPDFAEVIRSKASMAHGTLISLLGILKGGMSGYNRDSQQTKYLVMDLFRESKDAPLILSGVIDSLEVKREEMYQKCEIGFMNCADAADQLARKFELSFRDCYNLLSRSVALSQKEGKLTLESMTKAADESGLDLTITQDDLDLINSPAALIEEKLHTGSPSPISVQKMIDSQRNQLSTELAEFGKISDKINLARTSLFEA